jgi:hypothetical protein
MIHGITDVTLAQELGYWTIQNIFPLDLNYCHH